MKTRVIVWDSNPFNPYGAEVSRVLRDSRFCVYRICRTSSVYVNSDIPLLPAASVGNAAWWVKWRFGFSLGLLMTAAFLFRPIIIFPWYIHSAELRATRLLQRFGIRTVVVSHNPIRGRANGTGTALESEVRANCALIVVHDHSHRDLTECPRRTVVIPHPAYFAWVGQYLGPRHRAADGPVLWFGAYRSDKGIAHLERLGEEIRVAGCTLIVAPGALDRFQEIELREKAESFDLRVSDGHLSDGDLGRLIAECHSIVAPYENVTASGTVLMALSAGVPVIAFSNASLRSILPSAALCPSGDLQTMARLAVRAADAYSNEGPLDIASRLDQMAKEGWSRAVQRARASK